LTSILFTAKVSRGTVPHLRLKGNSLVFVFLFNCSGLVLDVQEIPKPSKDEDEEYPVKKHAGLLDELILAFQKRALDPSHVEDTHEMVHC
jgi:hypothetical protein